MGVETVKTVQTGHGTPLLHSRRERPARLAKTRAALDTAVFAACGWLANLSDAAILERLLALNLARAGTP